jgi:hypothetical protein
MLDGCDILRRDENHQNARHWQQMKPFPLLLCAIVLSTVPSARADALRCGDRLVTEGDKDALVRERCGAPSETRLERKLVPAVIWRDGRRIQLPGGDRVIVVEFWTYNLGPDRFMRQLKLEEGVVVEIKTLGYGHR